MQDTKPPLTRVQLVSSLLRKKLTCITIFMCICLLSVQLCIIITKKVSPEILDKYLNSTHSYFYSDQMTKMLTNLMNKTLNKMHVI